MMSHLTLIPELISDLTRAEKLEVYLKRRKLTFVHIAKSISVTPTSARRMLSNNFIPTWRFNQLLAAGIPEELLPPARDVAPGRKPKSQSKTNETDPNTLGQAA